MTGSANLLHGLRRRLITLQWQRGLRACIAVGSAMVVCHLLHQPPGAAALGAFDALLVDNGGPYRTRLLTMATVLVGGALALIAGSILPPYLALVILATGLVCFVTTFARVLSQFVASSSVLILVLYFAGLGGTQHTLSGALTSAAMVLLGGLWAVVLSLVLWPVDPFRPARHAIAECYAGLAHFTARLAAHEETHEDLGSDQITHATQDWRRHQRARIEVARAALASTVARAPSRTIRARNLTVLLETSDMLLARTIRLTELAELSGSATTHDHIVSLAEWLAGTERAISTGLAHKPLDGAASFAREGSQRVQFITRRRAALEQAVSPSDTLSKHLFTEERDALLELEIAFDAIRAIWTGADAPQLTLAGSDNLQPASRSSLMDGTLLDAIRANWTIHSVVLRHALRLMVVGVVDVLVMRRLHINHGFWLPMTSIILLQPYSAGTVRKSLQRVSGTVAGGILAALLAVIVPSQLAMIVVITILCSLTVATYAVDYAIYCFFLTPTFVLMSLPHPHDWRYALVRIGTTLVGALIAILAMRLLWPERAEAELGGLLRRGAAADASYIRALLLFWTVSPAKRRVAEREILAPARRACGLASNDVEEALDRIMQEPHFGRRARRELSLPEHALTFVTYLRRLTQSTTTLALVGRDTPLTHSRLDSLAARLDRLANPAALSGEAAENSSFGLAIVNVAEEQLQRMERQADVLERAAAALKPA